MTTDVTSEVTLKVCVGFFFSFLESREDKSDQSG